MKKEIPFLIGKDELLVRGIGHFIFYSVSDNKLKREAFLPPPDKSDVSLLRRNYTNDDFCKNHAMKLAMNGFSYCGLASFLCSQIDLINSEPTTIVKPIIKGTPIDRHDKYINTPPVFIDSPGLPMHADLVYPSPAIKGQVNTNYRQFAQKMIKMATYHPDPLPEIHGKWKGEPLLPFQVKN